MNLVRLGHYHVPTGRDEVGYCQTALVVKVTPMADGSMDYVNLVVWDSDGDQQRRLDVPVVAPMDTMASFHLSGDCPWLR